MLGSLEGRCHVTPVAVVVLQVTVVVGELGAHVPQEGARAVTRDDIGDWSPRQETYGAWDSWCGRPGVWGLPGSREGREVYGRVRTYEIVAARSPKHQLPSLK